MTIHILRDYLSPTSGSKATMPMAHMYYSSIFMFHTLRFTQVGQTNFNLSGSLMIASGLSASINLGVTGSFSKVVIPLASYTVGINDIGRILALRSTLFPAHNSGIFRITTASVVDNSLTIEYRSSEDPPVETSTLGWGIFAGENVITASTFTPLSASGYKSRDTYFGPRLMLQSPHSSSWQVRFCYESATDRTNHVAQVSVAVGFGGNASADFPTRSFDVANPVEHNHGPMFFDVSNSNYQGTTVGIEPTAGSIVTDAGLSIIRFYGWGDDVSGSCAFVTRNSSSYADGWYSFGMAEDDEFPRPPRTSQRLFTMGRAASAAQNVYWDNSPASLGKYSGVAFGLNMQPVNCVWAIYDYVSNASSGGGIKSEAVAQDNVMLGATELQKVDLWAGTQETGTHPSSNWPATAVLQFDPRRMGSMPLARLGRANFTSWSLTTDASKSWFHSKFGVFLPWSGPAIYA